MTDLILGAVLSSLIALVGVVYVQRVTRTLARQNRQREDDPQRDRIEAEAYERARESYEAARTSDFKYVERLETRIIATEKRAEAAEAQARLCSERLEVERRERQVEAERQAEEITRTLEEERRERRKAESREAEHAAEIRRLWVIVTALRDEIRRARLDVPEELLSGGIGTLPVDDAPHNEWSEHSKDQDRE